MAEVVTAIFQRRFPFLWAVVPALLWSWLFFHLHYEWSLNPQYSYGWAVPLIALFLFFLRWSNRPAARPALSRGAIRGTGWLLLALLLPLRIIEEANPDWRFLSWSFGFIVVAYSLLALARAGGESWVWHFAFPVCFPLVAVPWPAQLENLVVQGLTRAVAFAAVEIAGWIGVAAYQLGNVIELHDGFVGVNEACSGVKTLQAAIMVALFLGELFVLPLGRRIALLLAGCAWVFLCNIVRATTLVAIADRNGIEALGRWHDMIGTLVIVMGMSGLAAIAWFLQREEAGGQSTQGDEIAENSVVDGGSLPMHLGSLVWLAIIFATTELWYRGHEHDLVQLPEWQVRSSSGADSAHAVPIPEETRAILRYNDAICTAWENPAGFYWWSFFARWKPQRAALQLVRSHSPEICLPAVGRTFRRELPSVLVETKSLPLNFRAYEFAQQNRPLFVFVCIQEDTIARAAGASAFAEWNARGRLLAAWRGQRNLGQRLLEIAVIGFDDFSQAREALAAAVRGIVETRS